MEHRPAVHSPIGCDTPVETRAESANLLTRLSRFELAPPRGFLLPGDPAVALRGTRIRLPPGQGAEGVPLRSRRPAERVPGARPARSRRTSSSHGRRLRRRATPPARVPADRPGETCLARLDGRDQGGARVPRRGAPALPSDRNGRRGARGCRRRLGPCSAGPGRRCRPRRRSTGPGDRAPDCAPYSSRAAGAASAPSATGGAVAGSAWCRTAQSC